MIGILGFGVMLLIAWLLSSDRSRVNWRLVSAGVGLQVLFGIVVLKTDLGRAFFSGTGKVVSGLIGFTEEGSRFIFGNLVANNVPVGSPVSVPGNMAPLDGATLWANTGAYFAFSVLPVIIFFSTLTAVLYYLGVLQAVVKGIAWVMQRTMRTSGAETLSVAGNIFVGQTEAPLLIRPFIATLTRSELNTVMVGGFATIAGSVLAAYVGILSPFFPDVAGHLLTASVMNAPAALVISKLLMPERDTPQTADSLKVDVPRNEANVIEAAAAGASQGVQLAINVAAMLLAFIALLAMVNFGIGFVGEIVGINGLSFEKILGWVIAPLAWLMGVPWSDAGVVGGLIGVKVVATEFVAYLQLAGVMESSQALSDKGALIATYAILGFANIPSIAVQIGGIGGIAPSRRGELSRLGVKAMIGGNLAAFMSACLAGVLM